MGPTHWEDNDYTDAEVEETEGEDDNGKEKEIANATMGDDGSAVADVAAAEVDGVEGLV